MDIYTIRGSTLKNIADAIRYKTGKSDDMSVQDMPDEIRSIVVTGGGSGEMLLPCSEIPYYAQQESVEVASKVQSLLDKKGENNCIVSVCVSDTHYAGSQDIDSPVSGIEKLINASTVYAMQAVKILVSLLPVTFVAHLGDFAWGDPTTTCAQLKEQLISVSNWMEEAANGIPLFLAIGNHDTGRYTYGTSSHPGTNNKDDIISGADLYNLFTSKSNSSDTVFGDIKNGGYCYRDFAEKKLRVYLLNVNEGYTYFKESNGNKDVTMTDAQQNWFKNSLNELNNKNDAEQWKIILLSHQPADFDIDSLNKILKDYFESNNKAKFIAQYHGHIHSLAEDQIHYNVDEGNISFYGAHRVATPNACHSRNNEYGTHYGVNFYDAKYGSESRKPADNANATSLVVNVAVPMEEKIYSYCFGYNGTDREISYKIVKHSISKNLTNIELSGANFTDSIITKNKYTAKLTAKDGYTIDNNSVAITMGGIVVTDAYNSGTGVINIPEVTGDIAIIAKATSNSGAIVEEYTVNVAAENCTVGSYPSTVEKGSSLSILIRPNTGYNIKSVTVTMGNNNINSSYNIDTGMVVINSVTGIVTINVVTVAVSGGETPSYTNLVPASIGVDRQLFNNGLGYMNDTYASGTHYATKTGHVTTGYIYLPQDINVIYVKGATWNTSCTDCRLYMTSEQNIGNPSERSHTFNAAGTGGSSGLNVESIGGEGSGYYRMTLPSGATGRYYWMSLEGKGENLIITHNEPISD